jgi:hypothetical protein
MIPLSQQPNPLSLIPELSLAIIGTPDLTKYFSTLLFELNSYSLNNIEDVLKYHKLYSTFKHTLTLQDMPLKDLEEKIKKASYFDDNQGDDFI